MWNNAFAVKYDVNGDVPCSASTFGFDPQPGKAKQCFCDDIGYEDAECIETELAYWREQREVSKLTERSESSSRETSAAFESSWRIQEETQRKMLLEEERWTRETEERMRIEEE